MSNIVIAVNGNGAGSGFLIAPDNGINFSVPVVIQTNDGTSGNATLDATPNGAGISLPANAAVSPGGVTLQIYATAVSAAQGDTVINVHYKGSTTSFTLTAISNPEVWFQGRFEVRFATDNDWYNDPKGTYGAGNDGNNPLGYGIQGPGYTFWLEGEPLFTPQGVDSMGVPLSVPTTTSKPVGRVLRFNNPVALRSHALPVATAVGGVRGTLSNGTTKVFFTQGDPVIGATVDVGPNTYLAQNWEPHSPPDPMPAESQPGGATNEPMALFECHINGFFSGAPASDADRPHSSGFNPWADDPNAPFPTVTGSPTFSGFSTARLTALQADYAGLPAADVPTLDVNGNPMAGTGSQAGRNLIRRINMLTGAGGRPVSYQAAWEGQEEYIGGKINSNITFQANSSSVMSYFGGYTSFQYYNKLHTFHSDELDGYVYGSVSVDPTARLAKTCSFQIQNATFGKDQLISLGVQSMTVPFPAAFWVVLDGFFPSELGINAGDTLNNPPNPPVVTFSVDGSNANAAAIATALQTNGQMVIPSFSGQVFTTSLPPANAPQRILYPFTIQFSGVDGFIDQTETLTLNATITVNGKTYTASAPLTLTKAANPYVINEDSGNQYTFWLSSDLRTFTVDDDTTFFGKKVSDFYPPGAVAAQYPVTAQAASTAATAYISDLISRLTPTGAAGGNSFETDLPEVEAVALNELIGAQTNPATGKSAFNFAICRVRIQGTTPSGPGTTQAVNCRVFFRAFQAQNTAFTYNTSTSYRETAIGTPDVTPRVPFLGVQQDSMGQYEVVTIPFFAVDRVNLNGPANLTSQPPDIPNVQTISPQTGTVVDTYYGCWIDINQPNPLFPQFVKAGDFDNATGYFNTPGFVTQSIPATFMRAPHQCLIAEIAFDEVPIPPNADASTSDKLAQRNLAVIDGPNPGVPGSRRMPHPFQIQASSAATKNVDELMVAWGNTPAGATAEFYLPGITSAQILSLADSLYGSHTLKALDPNTIVTQTGPVTFIPIPRGTGMYAGLLTVDLPMGIHDGDLYHIVVRQLTDAAQLTRGGNAPQTNVAAGAVVPAVSFRPRPPIYTQQSKTQVLRWRKVSGAFQVNLRISTKQNLLAPEESRLALFRWIAEKVDPQSRWFPVMQRYIGQLAVRVTGFGGDPGKIVPSPGGLPYGPGKHGGHGGHGEPGGHHPHHHFHPPHGHPHEEATGKISGIVFDHFGNFEGFILETEEGEFRPFVSREKGVLEVVRRALEDRTWITVIQEPHRHDEVRSIVLRIDPLHHV